MKFDIFQHVGVSVGIVEFWNITTDDFSKKALD